MRIDLEHFRRLQAELDAINAIPLTDLEIYENGQRLEIAPDILEEFRFTGLSNVWFLREELAGKTEPCCECGEDFPRADLVLRDEVFCPACRRPRP